MNRSVFWARLLGLYTVVLATWSFVNIKQLHSLLEDLTHNTPISMTLGLLTLFLGLAIVVNHQIWKGWPIIVTLLGYWITLKGAVLLFFPEWINKMLVFWEGKNILLAPVPALLIGLILLFCGFFLHRHHHNSHKSSTDPALNR